MKKLCVIILVAGAIFFVFRSFRGVKIEGRFDPVIDVENNRILMSLSPLFWGHSQLCWVNFDGDIESVLTDQCEDVIAAVFESGTGNVFYSVEYNGIEGSEFWVSESLGKKQKMIGVYKEKLVRPLSVSADGQRILIGYSNITRTGDIFVGNTRSKWALDMYFPLQGIWKDTLLPVSTRNILVGKFKKNSEMVFLIEDPDRDYVYGLWTKASGGELKKLKLNFSISNLFAIKDDVLYLSAKVQNENKIYAYSSNGELGELVTTKNKILSYSPVNTQFGLMLIADPQKLDNTLAFLCDAKSKRVNPFHIKKRWRLLLSK